MPTDKGTSLSKALLWRSQAAVHGDFVGKEDLCALQTLFDGQSLVRVGNPARKGFLVQVGFEI